MKRETLVQRTGVSSTGTPHGLLIEREPSGGVRFTVVGHDGKKRHAAVILSDLDVLGLVATIGSAVTEGSE
jgi:hypothetical protein